MSDECEVVNELHSFNDSFNEYLWLFFCVIFDWIICRLYFFPVSLGLDVCDDYIGWLLRNANLFTYCFSAHVHLQSGSAGTFVQYIHIYVTLTIMRIINIGVVLSFCFVNFHCWIMFNDKLSIFFSFFCVFQDIYFCNGSCTTRSYSSDFQALDLQENKLQQKIMYFC